MWLPLSGPAHQQALQQKVINDQRKSLHLTIALNNPELRVEYFLTFLEISFFPKNKRNSYDPALVPSLGSHPRHTNPCITPLEGKRRNPQSEKWDKRKWELNYRLSSNPKVHNLLYACCSCVVLIPQVQAMYAAFWDSGSFRTLCAHVWMQSVFMSVTPVTMRMMHYFRTSSKVSCTLFAC